MISQPRRSGFLDPDTAVVEFTQVRYPAPTAQAAGAGDHANLAPGRQRNPTFQQRPAASNQQTEMVLAHAARRGTAGQR